MDKKQLILASNSPRRKELLALLQLPFKVVPADVDESLREGETAEVYVRRMALEKAAKVPAGPDDIVIAADTVVVNDGAILGKPKDNEEAFKILQSLRGKTHTVLTAINLVSGTTGQIWMDLCSTQVPMRDYSDEEIRKYVASGDPLDKAGAYAIQHAEFNPVETLRGCYASVMGLPLCHLTRSLRMLGVEVPVATPQVCQDALSYDCPVHQDILFI